MTDAYPHIATEDMVGDEYSRQAALVRSILANHHSATLVQIKAVHASATPPVVDVLPMVNQIDGQGTGVPHNTLYGIPFTRLQGGTSAVKMDPIVGDIGILVVASRDISKVKNTKAPANPDSRRRHSMSDGMYIGGLLNATPVRYIEFTGSAINIVEPTTLNINAPTVAITGNSVTHNGHEIGYQHKHVGVQTGASLTGVPQ